MEGFVEGSGEAEAPNALVHTVPRLCAFRAGEPFLSRGPLEDTLQMQEDAGHGEPS